MLPNGESQLPPLEGLAWLIDPVRVCIVSHRVPRATENYFIRQDQQDLRNLKVPKSRWLERLRLTGVWFLLKYLLDTDSDPQITQIPQTLYRKCIRDRSRVA